MTNQLSNELGEVVAALENVTDGAYLERLANGQVIALQCVEFIRTHHAALAAMVAERDALREALLRARQWGGMGKGWDSSVTLDLMAWIEGGMRGPLPPLPDYLQDTARQAAGEVKA